MKKILITALTMLSVMGCSTSSINQTNKDKIAETSTSYNKIINTNLCYKEYKVSMKENDEIFGVRFQYNCDMTPEDVKLVKKSPNSSILIDGLFNNGIEKSVEVETDSFILDGEEVHYVKEQTNTSEPYFHNKGIFYNPSDKNCYYKHSYLSGYELTKCNDTD